MNKIVSINADASFKDGYSDYSGVVIELEDGRSIKFGISQGHNCCESFDYLHSVDDADEFIGSEFVRLEERDTWPATLSTTEKDAVPYGFDSGGFQAIDIVTDKGVMQFVVYNSHNGYYSHSVITAIGDAVQEEYL